MVWVNNENKLKCLFYRRQQLHYLSSSDWPKVDTFLEFRKLKFNESPQVIFNLYNVNIDIFVYTYAYE